MKVPISNAKALLTELVRRAEHGEEVLLTRFGRPAVRLSPVGAPRGAAARRKVLRQIRDRAAAKAAKGPGAARSQDFLYDRTGLPK